MGARLNQNSRYIHLLRAMNAGDVLYLPCLHSRMAELLRVAAAKEKGKCKTDVFIALARTPESAVKLIRVTTIRPMRRS